MLENAAPPQMRMAASDADATSPAAALASSTRSMVVSRAFQMIDQVVDARRQPSVSNLHRRQLRAQSRQLSPSSGRELEFCALEVRDGSSDCRSTQLTEDGPLSSHAERGGFLYLIWVRQL